MHICSQSVQSLNCVWLFATPWIAACQASLSITNSQSLLKFMSIESMMPSSHLILCHPLLLLPPIPPSIRVFSSESTLCMKWPKYLAKNPLCDCISFHYDNKWELRSFSPLLFTSLLFTAICKASSDNHFCCFAFLFHGDGLDPCLLYNVMHLHP